MTNRLTDRLRRQILIGFKTMGSVHRVVFVALIAIFSNIALADNNVPVFMWNIDS